MEVESMKRWKYFKRRILKNGGKLLCCLCTDVMNLERAEQRKKDFKMKVAKAAAMLGDS